MTSKKTPFIPLHVRGKDGAATPEDLNRVQDQVRAAFKKIQQGGVTQVTSKDGTVVITPKSGVGAVDLSAAKPFGSRATGATTLDAATNAPNDLVSTAPQLYLQVTIDGVNYVCPLWQRKPSSGFTPPDGCKLWLDASDLDSVHSTAGAVTQWDDISGNGFHLDVQIGSPSISSVNGLQAVRTSVGNKLQRAAALLTGGHPRDIYVVAKLADNTGCLSVGMGSHSGGFNVGWENIGGSNRYYFVQWFGPDALINDGGHNYTNETHVFRYSCDFSGSNSVAAELDGSSPGSASWDGTFTADDGAAYFGVGGFADATAENSRDWNGWICEVLVFDHVLSSADATTVRNYLKSKWGTP